MIILPKRASSEALADWLELSVLFGHRSLMSNALLLTTLEDAELDRAEETIADIRMVIEQRHRQIGKTYPIRKEGTGFRRKGKWSEFCPYTFLLLVSLNRHYKELRFRCDATEPARLFEHLSCWALERYLGSAYRVSPPRCAPVPKAFKDSIAFVSKQSCEPVGAADLVSGKEQDEGLDVIAWRSFDDGRPGQLVLFAQCAVGARTRRKQGEALASLWKKYVDWHAKPIPALAVPFHETDDKEWKRACFRLRGVFVDRLRIMKLLGTAALPQALVRKMRSWCQRRSKLLPRSAA